MLTFLTLISEFCLENFCQSQNVSFFLKIFQPFKLKLFQVLSWKFLRWISKFECFFSQHFQTQKSPCFSFLENFWLISKSWVLFSQSFDFTNTRNFHIFLQNSPRTFSKFLRFLAEMDSSSVFFLLSIMALIRRRQSQRSLNAPQGICWGFFSLSETIPKWERLCLGNQLPFFPFQMLDYLSVGRKEKY